MKTKFLITIVLIITFTSFKYRPTETHEKYELHFYDNDNFFKYLIKRTIVNNIYTDTIYYNDGKFNVDIFNVNNGEWIKIMKDKELPYFSAIGILNDEYILNYFGDGSERNKFKLIDSNYRFLGLKCFEVDWYYSDLNGEYKVGEIVFNESIGPVIYKYPERGEISLKKIIRIY